MLEYLLEKCEEINNGKGLYWQEVRSRGESGKVFKLADKWWEWRVKNQEGLIADKTDKDLSNV